MKLTISDRKTGGDLLLLSGETNFDRFFYSRDKEKKYFTIAWNRGEHQTITIDGIKHDFSHNTIVSLMFDQTFSFERPADIVAWQFNREFYCIIDHDAEVSCVGFLFGMGDLLFIDLDDNANYKLSLLLNIFIEELNTRDNIQSEMITILLKRLIIFVTKLAKSEYVPESKLNDQKLDIFRRFNLLVEQNFRSEHSVNYYAMAMNKSPKTLSNIFALYNQKTPQQVIRERILTEAKRLLYYTSKSVKQITYELGFEDPAYFSSFFKKLTQLPPLEFRNNAELVEAGK
ncbi:helix-turn-helix domain-containing protein [Mucilaginibacter sp. cycad4]|uniref:helix-turn-helix domain-containing protein n=1 Tax=Mucilaginibacter sp. cycad4 TaxID=3342096 RepID=UPI002AABDAE6|nr:helix-turn-helix domain-containing protein [Mucilaginibacter gossypii]WPU99174.1 helix-turn-helix domain-containing protein [Mucilaginibacter gossypii]